MLKSFPNSSSLLTLNKSSMYKKVLLNCIAGALLVPIGVPLLLPENKTSDTHITDIDVVDKKVNSDLGKDL